METAENAAQSSAVETDETTGPAAHDLLTVVAVGIVAFTLATVLHEGLGHGGACAITGCRPLSITSMSFDGDAQSLGSVANRFIAANGTIVNLILGVVFLAILRRAFQRGLSAASVYFIWLFAVMNLLLGTGYLLYSGVAGMGDWASVTGGWQPLWLWRVLLAVTGFFGYYMSLYTALFSLGPFIGPGETVRIRLAARLMLLPYAGAVAVSCASGALNPGGFRFALVSGIAASLGGLSGFLWAPFLLNGTTVRPYTGTRLAIHRSVGWLVAGLIAALLYVFLLGPGIRFSPK